MQSRAMSLVEAISNVVVGYGLAVVTQMIVFPWFGLNTTVRQNLGIGLIFTVVSLIRSYTSRRLFNMAKCRQSLERKFNLMVFYCR